MSDAPSIPAPSKSRSWLRPGWIATIAVVGLITLWTWHGRSANRGILERLRAQGLPTSPSELHRWYAQVPPQENLALPLMEAAGAVRSPVQKGGSNYPYFSGRNAWTSSNQPFAAPPHPVAPDELARWRKVVDGMPEAWAAMERARGRPSSRYPVDLRQGFSTVLGHLAPVKSLANACALRALVAMEDGKPAEAARALEDGLLVHQSLVPEPLLISQLVANAALSITLDATTDVLSAGPLPGDALERMQHRLEALATTNRYAQGMVGEMACVMEIFHGSPAQQARAFGLAGMGAGPGTPTGAQFAALAMMTAYSALGLNARDEHFFLVTLTQAIEASRLPWPDALRASPRMGDLLGDQGGLGTVLKGRMKSRMILPALDQAMAKDGEALARLRLGAAMLAIERYRAAHEGRLPRMLQDLVPAYLPSVPMDPFDGQPLRYQPAAQGYSLHSIGKDLQDHDARTIQRSKAAAFTEQDVVLRVRR